MRTPARRIGPQPSARSNYVIVHAGRSSAVPNATRPTEELRGKTFGSRLVGLD
jgi:hypothetical protein